MESTNKLGIWMDHSEANLIHLKADNENQVIRSKFSFSTKEEALQKGEKHMHTKEQHLHEAYYKEIANEILNTITYFFLVLQMRKQNSTITSIKICILNV